MIPDADILYACDRRWWLVHEGCPDFKGEKWSSHHVNRAEVLDDKSEIWQEYGLNLIRGESAKGFSTNPSIIHYGGNSGFQAVNIALLKGARPIVLVGFDMRVVKGRRHFFGDHPRPLRNSANYISFVRAFRVAAKMLPKRAVILNATLYSALLCFPEVDLEDVLRNHTR